MTQKELLYLEDAVCHEKVIITCINSIINNLKEEELVKYMNKEKETHEKMQKNLMNILEDNNE